MLASGQIMSGVSSRKAVPITALVEGIVSAAGVAYYYFANHGTYFNVSLIASLLIGGLVSTPLAAVALKKLNPEKLRYIMGALGIIVGISIFVKIFFL